MVSASPFSGIIFLVSTRSVQDFRLGVEDKVRPGLLSK